MIEQIKYYFFLSFQSFGNLINSFYRGFALIFDYPGNPGMPVIKPANVISYFERSSYPTFAAPIDAVPQNWWECFIGTSPEIFQIQKFFYVSESDGYYNFYINTYGNTFFLPDWLSQWLQLNFDMHLDVTLLETLREAIFVFLLFYMKFVAFRLNLFWFITINPFVRPWIYLTSLIDWSYEMTADIVPGFFGLDMGIIIYLAVLGKLLDSFNCLVFTMPFLPSEAQLDIVKKDSNFFYSGIPDLQLLLGKNDTKEVIFFRYLPQLWYTYPIPNQLREFWFYQRQDILKYMLENYEQLGINFYPDNILNELQQYHISEPYPDNIQKLEGFLDMTFVNCNDFFLLINSKIH